VNFYICIIQKRLFSAFKRSFLGKIRVNVSDKIQKLICVDINFAVFPRP